MTLGVDGRHPHDGPDPVLDRGSRPCLIGFGQRVDRRRIEAADAVVQHETAGHHEAACAREGGQGRGRDRMVLEHGPEARSGRLVAERYDVIAAGEHLGPDVDMKVDDWPVAVARERHPPMVP